MSDAGFVIAAWVITALVLGGYALRIALRIAAARGEKTLFKRVAPAFKRFKDDGDSTVAAKSKGGVAQ